MQKFKRFLVGTDSNIWASSKRFPDGKEVILLNAGKQQVALIATSETIAKVQVPGMDFEEQASPEMLSKKAMRIVNVVKSYLN